MPDPVTHSLLRRQLKKAFGPDFEVPPRWLGFIRAVDDAYKEFDTDREMLERSLDLSSEELLRANSRTRAVLLAFPDVFLWLERDGTIVQALSSDQGILRAPRGDLVGKRIQEIPSREVGSRVAEAMRKASETGRVVSVEYDLVVEGNQEHHEARFIPIGEKELLAVIRDVSPLKQAEEERARASKLDSLGILAGGIAHDFNNILAGIIANVSLVRTFRGDDSEEDLDEILGDAEQACYRARDLTMQLLTFSKGGAPIRTSGSITELAKEVTVFALRGSSVGCEFLFDEDVRSVDMDVGQISQVVNNLVINSAQSMPEGGVVTITARNVGEEDERVFPIAGRAYVEITVSDKGAGISREHLPRVFDPYFTTKADGSGLGLATCYSIVQRHEGLISISSTQGNGTVVSVCLPSARPRPPLSSVPPSALAVGAGRILIMDDEEQILKAAGRILTRLGYETDYARHGAQALDMCRESVESGEPYLLAILDLTIPGGMGGERVAKELREKYPDIWTVASSGYSNSAVIADYRSGGFNDILPKPYGLTELNDLLHRAGV